MIDKFIVVTDNCGTGDTRYVLGFMENFETTDGSIHIAVVTSSDGALVFVTSPKWGSPAVDQSKSVAPTAVDTFTISANLRHSGIERTRKGILLESTGGGFQAYGLSAEPQSCEAFLALPVSSLGTEYHAVAYWPPSQETEIVVVATEDDTEVTLTFMNRRGVSIDYNGVPYGDQVNRTELTVALDAHESLQLQDSSDLTGTRVTSNRPVAVFSGNKGTSVITEGGDSAAHLAAQLPPTDTWGTTYMVAPVPGRSPTVLKVVSRRAGTMVTFQSSLGSSTWTALTDGDFWEYLAPGNSPLSAVATGQITAVQYYPSGTTRPSDSANPAMALVPATSQYTNAYDFATFANIDGNNHVMVIIRSSDISGLSVDGVQQTTSGWQVVPGVPGYAAKVISLSASARHQLRHSDPRVRYGAMVYGSSSEVGCTYAYPAGLCLDEQVCILSW